jgi:dsRNA-specific ribonuclease
MTSKKTLLQDGDITQECEILIFDPFNPRNKEITEKQVHKFLSDYGINDKIHNLNLYKRAFVHKSYVKRPQLENQTNGVQIVEKPNNCLKLKSKSNERLEFLGDGVLELITKYELYRRFPKANEGFMTEKKIALVKNEAIGKMAYDMGLNKYYIISKNAEEKKTRTNLKKLGCLFEAFLGALFLDFNKVEVNDDKDWFKSLFTTGPGFQMAQKFVEHIFAKHVNWKDLLENDDNYKNILQVLIQKQFKTTPVYKEISSYDENLGYHMGVYICLGQKSHSLNHNDSVPWEKFGSFKNIETKVDDVGMLYVFLSESKHKIKKKAEQRACQIAIQKIKN